MLDFPIPPIEHHAPNYQPRLFNPHFFSLQRDIAPAPSQEELFKIAENYKECFSHGFDWNCFSQLTVDTYHYLQKYDQISVEEREDYVLTVLNHFIDITDTPWLPDDYTDPVLKALMPPLINSLGATLAPFVPMIASSQVTFPTTENLSLFIEELKATFIDGLQIQDIPICITATIKFLGSFFFLDIQEKKQCVLSIVDTLIDSTNVPGPDFMVHPIIKQIIHPFIETIFSYLTFL